MVYELSNEMLTAQFSDMGAELMSLKNNKTGQEYMWHGDKKYWGRRSPILFPMVGRLREGKYTYNGKEYKRNLAALQKIKKKSGLHWTQTPIQGKFIPLISGWKSATVCRIVRLQSFGK